VHQIYGVQLVHQIYVNVEPVQLLRHTTDDIVQCVNACVEIAVFYFNNVGRHRPVCEHGFSLGDIVLDGELWTQLPLS